MEDIKKDNTENTLKNPFKTHAYIFDYKELHEFTAMVQAFINEAQRYNQDIEAYTLDIEPDWYKDRLSVVSGSARALLTKLVVINQQYVDYTGETYLITVSNDKDNDKISALAVDVSVLMLYKEKMK